MSSKIRGKQFNKKQKRLTLQSDVIVSRQEHKGHYICILPVICGSFTMKFNKSNLQEICLSTELTGLNSDGVFCLFFEIFLDCSSIAAFCFPSSNFLPAETLICYAMNEEIISSGKTKYLI